MLHQNKQLLVRTVTKYKHSIAFTAVCLMMMNCQAAMSNIKKEIQRLSNGEDVSEGLEGHMDGLEVSW